MKKHYTNNIIIIMLALIAAFSFSGNIGKASEKTYVVSPNAVPDEVKASPVYNSITKNWLQLQYYLKKLQSGGGRLVLKKGTYKINNTLYVPSNTTIELKDGAVLKKTSKKTKGIMPANNMFALIAYDKKDKKDASAKYNGPKNIKFIGNGENSVIDLANIKIAHGISSSHNMNITFENITFKGENGGHYIELCGAKNVTIKGNRFLHSNAGTKDEFYNKESINIDTADNNTKGFTVIWSKKDQTPNVNIKITDNLFDGVNRAIGTHKYSQKKDSSGKYSENSQNVYHQNIQITGNTFKNIYDNGIFLVNWKDATIKDNTFTNIGVNNKRNTNTARHAIAGGGTKGLTICGNVFTKVENGSSIYFRCISNNDSGSEYYPVKSDITDDELKIMEDNEVIDCSGESAYPEWDILIFSGYEERARDNAYGMNLTTKEWLP